MSGSAISSAGIPSPADLEIDGAIERWVSAASDPAAALAAVVHRVAAFRGIDVQLVVDGEPIAPDANVAAVAVADAVIEVAGPWLPGFLREALVESRTRRRRGVHHTSPAMARTLVEFVVDLHPFDHSTVVADPAVGGGAFLLAACELLPGSRSERVKRVVGSDIDSLAVAITEASLRLWADGSAPTPGAIRVADGLSAEGFVLRPNVVVGNPPFLSQLRDNTTRSEQRRAELRNRWPDVGGYVDDAAAFLLAAVDQVADGGAVALVQPNSFLSVRDGAPIRARLQRDAPVVGVWLDGQRQFDASVDTVAIVVKKGGEPGPVQRIAGVPARPLASLVAPASSSSWASLLLDDTMPQVHRRDLHQSGRVSDVARVTAGFRAQFYGLRGAVSEDEAANFRLITSGLIDPLECRWGMASCRFDRVQWTHPSVDPTAVAPEIRDWIAARIGPKLLIASQTKVIEVVVDFDGRMIPCTPVVSVEPRLGAPSLSHLAAALSSPVAAALLLAEAAGSALSRDAMRVSASTIGALPLPVPGPAWDLAAAGVDALGSSIDRAELVEIGRLGMVAYGLGDRVDILKWWEQRLPRR